MLYNRLRSFIPTLTDRLAIATLSWATSSTAFLYALFVNVNIRMYNFDDVQCTVIPSVAYGFVTGMNLQLC